MMRLWQRQPFAGRPTHALTLPQQAGMIPARSPQKLNFNNLFLALADLVANGSNRCQLHSASRPDLTAKSFSLTLPIPKSSSSNYFHIQS
jgi:hypothetical protein